MKRFLLLICLVVVYAALPLNATHAQNNPDALIFGITGGDISTLNPALATDGNSNSVIAQIYAGLFKADPDTGQPKPNLATWTASDDSLAYTFTLKDAKWSDGKPITSADVKFTYDAIVSDKVQSPRKADVALIKSIDIKDDKTFTVNLTQVNCTVWGNTFGVLIPLPKHKFKEDFSDFMTTDFNTKPDVGSGPYLFEEHKAGEYVRLKANPTYFDGTPKIGTVIYRVIADVATVNQALQTDTVDYAFMYPDQLEQLQGKDKFNTFLFPNPNTPILVMNYQDSAAPQAAYDKDGKPNTLKPNKFFADKRVRQAVAMGYDKDSLTKTLGTNSGSTQLSGPITPSFYNVVDVSAVKPWPYDPKKAAELLDEAGWKLNSATGIREKDGVPFQLKLIYSPLIDLWKNIATVAQDQLGQLGIKLEIQEMEWSAYLKDVLLPYKYDITIVGFGGGTEIDGIAYNLLNSKNVSPNGGFNLAGYVNPKVDDLLVQARTMKGCPIAERAKLYAQIQQIALDDVAYDWTVSTTQVHVLNKRVQNARYGQWNPTNINLWTLGK